MLVVDASVVVAALVDGGTDGDWAGTVLVDHELAAPHLMPIAATNILRRAARSRSNHTMLTVERP